MKTKVEKTGIIDRIYHTYKLKQQDKYISERYIRELEEMKGPDYHPVRLPDHLKKEYLDFYAGYGFQNVPLDFIEYIYSITGDFHVGYVPDTLYHRYIDPYFPITKFEIANKNLQPLILRDLVSYPEMLTGNMDGRYIDSSYQTINELSALKTVSDYLEQTADKDEFARGVICKPAIFNGAGTDVSLITDADELITAFRRKYKRDFVVQKRIEQHPVMASFNQSSVNTVRILTFMHKGKAHVISAFVRTGAPGSCVDNATGHTNHYHVGISLEGRLDATGYNCFGEKRTTDLSGKPYAEYQIEQYPEMVRIAKAGHEYLLNHKVVGWDFAVDRNGEVILIEYNFKGFPITEYAVVSGPLFGDMLDEILKEAAVYKQKLESNISGVSGLSFQ